MYLTKPAHLSSQSQQIPGTLPQPNFMKSYRQLSCDRDLHFDSGFDIDDDLFHDFRGSTEINQSLMNTKLKCIPGLATFTTGCFARGDFEGFCWETDGALHNDILGLGPIDQFFRHPFKGLNVSARKGNANSMHIRLLAKLFLEFLRHGHDRQDSESVESGNVMAVK